MLLGLGAFEQRRVAAQSQPGAAPSEAVDGRLQQVTTATATPRLIVWTPTPNRAATERAGATATVQAGRTATVAAAGTIAAGTARSVRATSEARGTVWPTAEATGGSPGDPGPGRDGTPPGTAPSPTPVGIEAGPGPGTTPDPTSDTTPGTLPDTTPGPRSGPTGAASLATGASTPRTGAGTPAPAGADAAPPGPGIPVTGPEGIGASPGSANPGIAIIAGLSEAPSGGWPARQAAPWIPPVDDGTINGMWAVYGSPWGDVPLRSRLVADKPGPFGSLLVLATVAAGFLAVGVWLLTRLGRRAGHTAERS